MQLSKVDFKQVLDVERFGEQLLLGRTCFVLADEVARELLEQPRKALGVLPESLAKVWKEPLTECLLQPSEQGLDLGGTQRTQRQHGRVCPDLIPKLIRVTLSPAHQVGLPREPYDKRSRHLSHPEGKVAKLASQLCILKDVLELVEEDHEWAAVGFPRSVRECPKCAG